MRYKHLHLAFFYELVVGLMCLYCVFAVGVKGMVILAAIALRPFVLETAHEPPDQRILRIYYEGNKWSVLLTGATILITYLLFNYLPVSSHGRGIVFLTTIPWFVLIHGLVGFIVAWPERESIS